VKRGYFKTRIMVLAIVCLTLVAVLTAVFFQVNSTGAQPEQPRVRIINIEPLPGHWLKTDQENWYTPAKVENLQAKTAAPVPQKKIAVQQDTKAAVQRNAKTAVQRDAKPAIRRDVAVDKVMPVYTLESARTSLNRGVDSINIMYVWSDGDRLKIISITSLNTATRQAALVVIPLGTVVNVGRTVSLQDKWVTIQDIYREQGREGVKDLLEEKLEITIPVFIYVNQTALQKISNIVGVLKVNGDEITMLDAFEQTMLGIRTDDRDVVRAVTARILRPQMLFEVPKLLWIFTHDVKTNLSAEQMLRIFNTSRQMDLGNMRKTALPGYELDRNSLKFVLVSEQTWKNIIYELTLPMAEARGFLGREP